MENRNLTVLTIWGMIQFMAMLLLGVSQENTWIIYGLVISDIGMMYLFVDYKEKLEAKLKGE